MHLFALPTSRVARAPPALLAGCIWLACATAYAQHEAPAAPKAAPARMAASAVSAGAGSATAQEVAQQLRAEIDSGAAARKRMTLVVGGKEKKFITMPGSTPGVMPAPVHGAVVAAPVHAAAPVVPAVPGRLANPHAVRLASSPRPSRAAEHGAHGAEVHWSYEGESGPQAWGRLKPEFNACATGQRQSPINIDDTMTLQGPAEALQFDYLPSSASVVNNGHTIQVDVQGDSSLTVRGANYRLLQFHFHNPSEERINHKAFALVAHLVHRNPEGQLAVVAVLFEPGAANALVNKVWTYMPLDVGDRVRMPAGALNLAELLPRDQRYYQFMGSLTPPPCSEGVLWMVLKQPVPLSREQLRLFAQLFPNNARPVQPLNGRAVRDAQ